MGNGRIGKSGAPVLVANAEAKGTCSANEHVTIQLRITEA